MTISNSNNNLASLVSRIEQLETQQEIWKKNTIWLKRCFDELKQEFNKLTELSDVKSTQEKVLQLSAQLEELQQSFERSPDVIVESHEAIEEVDIDDGSRQNHLVDVTKLAKVEEDEEIVSAEEFWQRYEEGERDFKGINLTGVDFNGKSLYKVNFNRANLSRANLRKTTFKNVDLTKANLSRANLLEANLSNINLMGNWLGGNLDGANLAKANLCGAHLRRINFKDANLTSADLSGADLRDANLENACLVNANLAGAILDGANLTGAMMPDGTTHE